MLRVSGLTELFGAHGPKNARHLRFLFVVILLSGLALPTISTMAGSFLYPSTYRITWIARSILHEPFQNLFFCVWLTLPFAFLVFFGRLVLIGSASRRAFCSALGGILLAWVSALGFGVWLFQPTDEGVRYFMAIGFFPVYAIFIMPAAYCLGFGLPWILLPELMRDKFDASDP